MIPAEPSDAPSQHGHGFPRRFRLVASSSPDFASPRVIADHMAIAFPNPGDNPVILPAGDVTARFIRLEVNELWHITNGTYALALAEMQVYEDGHNIATGAGVTASDVFRKPPFDHQSHSRHLREAPCEHEYRSGSQSNSGRPGLTRSSWVE